MLMETYLKKIKSLKKTKIRLLTKNEKFLLTALGMIIVIWVSIRFVITPQAEALTTLEAEKLELDIKITGMNNTLKMENKIKSEWKALHRERNTILSRYFPTLDQSQIIYLLNDLIVDDRVKISNLNFSEPTSELVGEMDVQQMSISIPFSGSYDGIVDVVGLVGSNPRRIIVDTLSMDRSSNTDLDGNMSLKIFSLEGLANTDSEVVNVEPASSPDSGSIFGAFEGYHDRNQPMENSSEIDKSDYTKIYMLHDFENRNYSFVPSNKLIKGDATPSTIRKSGKYSLRLEYNMFALGEENRAYIDISSINIEFKYPPESISMWVNAFGYSPGTLGFRFRTQDGEDIDVTLSEGISWLGWSNVEASPPADLNLYPLSLTHIYYELPYNRDDVGVFLIDKLEAKYPVSEDTAANNRPANYFYVVEVGDTVTSISKKIYGTVAYKNEIMKNNSLTSGDILTVGKVLVLVRR